jgi:hypothetical protein
MAARWLRPLAVLSLLAVFAPRPAAAQASIAGRVTEAETGAPVPEARVLLVGSALTTTTGQDGRYALRGVPTGPQVVRVLRVGYKEQRKSTTVGVGAQVGMDFSLERSAVQLEEIVSTATGSRPREELGNSVSTINTAEVTKWRQGPHSRQQLVEPLERPDLHHRWDPDDLERELEQPVHWRLAASSSERSQS